MSRGSRAPRRPGPIPLVLHMAMARSHYASAQAALHDALSGRNTAGIGLPALNDWRETFGDVTHADMSAALGRHCEARLASFLSGIERYQTDAFARPDTQARPVLSVAGVTLLRHDGGGRGRDAGGTPVLLVPSLINPAWVLDLMPQRSFASYLSARGFQVFSIDWGTPGAAEQRFHTQDYILQRLVPALQHVSAAHGPTHLAGYCLGGNLALAAALDQPDAVRSFCAIAMPWDFTAMGPAAQRVVATTHDHLKPVLAKTGLMPADALQALFAQLDPTQMERKFVKFASLDPANPEHRKAMDHFIAVEDWSNEGPPLVRGVVEDCFTGFYQDNMAMRGQWRVGARMVRPEALSCASLVLAAGKDKIVPQASTLALAQQLPGADVLTPQAGHVGMMVGSKAQELCWKPVADWFAAQPA